MENTFFCLSTCKTCQRVQEELGSLLDDVKVQNVKEQNIDAKALDFAKEKTGSYESLFNKRAMKYRSQGLNKKEISDAEFRELILGEYTFMKRPLAIVDGEVYAGHAKKTLEGLKEALNG